jgi:hypothetical protein
MNGKQLNWSDLFSFGNLITVTISMFYFKVAKVLTDFGIDTESINKKAGTQGHWYIIPETARIKLQNYGYRIRKLVDDYAIPFPLVEGGRFIPDASVPDLMMELDQLKVDFFNEVDSIVADYDNLRDEQEPFIVEEIRKVAGYDYDCRPTIDRIEACIPTATELRSKFNVRHNLFAFTAPINQEVAETLEQEEESVKSAIGELIENAKKPLLEKVNTLLDLVKKNNKRSFNTKSINAGLRDCDRFARQNVFNDPFIGQSIRQLRYLLEQVKADIENGETEEFQLGLTELKESLEQKPVKDIQNAVVSNLGKRKLL